MARRESTMDIRRALSFYHKGPRDMPYLNRTIRLSFDGTDNKLPTLGDDIWVVIRNPLLMPGSMLETNVTLDENGNVTDTAEAMKAGYEIAARLVVDWNVYDPEDFSDNPTVLPLPATAETMKRLPLPITNAIGEIVGKAMDRTT